MRSRRVLLTAKIIRTLWNGTISKLYKNIVVEMKLTTCCIRRNVQLGRIIQGGKMLVECLTVAEGGTFDGALRNSWNFENLSVIGYHSNLRIE